jgi:hypothetical protein
MHGIRKSARLYLQALRHTVAVSSGACDTSPTGVQTRGTIMHNAKPLSRVVQLTAPPSPPLTCTTGQEAPMGDHRMPWYPSPLSSRGDPQTLGCCKDLASAHIDDRGALQACWGLLDLNG